MTGPTQMPTQGVGFDGDLADQPEESPKVKQPVKPARPKPQAKPKRPAKSAAGKEVDQADRPVESSIRCERCSADGEDVLCVADPKRPGWVSCPTGCGFRHKPFDSLARLKAQRAATQAAMDRSAR